MAARLHVFPLPGDAVGAVVGAVVGEAPGVALVEGLGVGFPGFRITDPVGCGDGSGGTGGFGFVVGTSTESSF